MQIDSCYGVEGVYHTEFWNPGYEYKLGSLHIDFWSVDMSNTNMSNWFSSFVAYHFKEGTFT